MEELDIIGCGLDNVPTVLNPLRDLRWLDLSDNMIGDLPGWMAQFSQLRWLGCERNSLHSLCLAVHAWLENVQGVTFEGNPFAHRYDCLLNGKIGEEVPRLLSSFGQSQYDRFKACRKFFSSLEAPSDFLGFLKAKAFSLAD